MGKWHWGRIFAAALSACLMVKTFVPEIFKNIEELYGQRIEKKLSSFIEKEGYQITQGKYCQVYSCKENSDYVWTICRMCDTYYPLLLHDFGMEDSEKLKFILYEDEKSMCEVLGITPENVPMGAYYCDTIHVLNPEVWTRGEQWQQMESFLEDGPILHEMAHYFLDKKLQKKYDLWFTEGIALYYENKYTGFEWRPDLEKVAVSISLEELKKNFTSLDEAKAYRRSYDIICSIAKEDTQNGVRLLLDKMEEGMSFEQAARKLGCEI